MYCMVKIYSVLLYPTLLRSFSLEQNKEEIFKLFSCGHNQPAQESLCAKLKLLEEQKTLSKHICCCSYSTIPMVAFLCTKIICFFLGSPDKFKFKIRQYFLFKMFLFDYVLFFTIMLCLVCTVLVRTCKGFKSNSQTNARRIMIKTSKREKESIFSQTPVFTEDREFRNCLYKLNSCNTASQLRSTVQLQQQQIFCC